MGLYDKVFDGFDRLIRFLLYGLALSISFGNAPVEIFANSSAVLFLLESLCRLVLNPAETRVYVKDDFFRRPVFIAVVCYVVWNILSAVMSVDVAQSRGAVFTKLLEGVLIFFACLFHIRKREHLRIFAGLFLFGALIAVIDGIYQWFFGVDFIRGSSLHFRGAGDRVSAAFKHSNGFGGYLICVLPVIMTLFFSKRKQTVEDCPTCRNPVFLCDSKFYLLGMLILGLCALGLTFSRGAWLGLFVALCFLSFKTKKIFLSVLAIVIIFSSVFFPLFLSKRPVSLDHATAGPGYFFSWDFFKEAGSGRDRFWNDALHMAMEHPFFGFGLNTYTEALRGHPDARQGFYAHNCYLQMAAEIGFAGLAVFLAVLIVFWREFFQKLRYVEDEFLLNMVWGMGAGFMAFLVHAFFDTTMYSVQLGMMHWLFMGLILAVFRMERPVCGD